MPITVNIVDHAATTWKGNPASTPEKLLEEVSPRLWRRCQRIEQSSFSQTLQDNAPVSASENGFVWAAYHAYSSHRHLILRPEDIWFSILSQLSFYINAHAEELRAFFVAHEGKKDLEALSGVRDFGALALQMTGLMQKEINDPQLKDWVMPDFTTTTDVDRVVGAVLFMGAMQAYFEYFMTITCGIPSVTLLGEEEDWRKILTKLDMIDQLGAEPKHFANMLRPILKHMILTFEDSSHPDVSSFWNRILHHHQVGSGTDYLSGWLTAFCFWDDEGKAKRLDSKWSEQRNVLFDDEIEYPYVDIDKISLGFVSMPVHVDDNGDVYDATMLAGSLGIAATSRQNNATLPISVADGDDASFLQSNNESQATTVHDTLQPVSGWLIYRNEKPEVAAAREAEINELEAMKQRQSEELNAWKKALKESGGDMLEFYESPQWEEHMRIGDRLRELRAF